MSCLIKGVCQIIHNKLWQFILSENLGLNRCENVPVTAKYLLMLMGALKLKLGRKIRLSFPPLQPASVNIAFDILAKQCSLSPFWIFCLHGSQSRDCADLPSPLQFIALIQPDVRVSRFGRRPML